MKTFFLLFALLSISAHAAGRIQNENVKSYADLQRANGSITGSVTNGSACIASPSSISGLVNGLFVYDATTSANIPSGSTVAGIPGTCPAGEIQMSAAAAGTGLGDLITFGGQLSQLINDTKIYVTANGLNQTLATVIGNGSIVLGAGQLNARFVLSGAVVPYIAVDGAHYQANTKSLTAINLSMLDSGNSGSTVVQVNQFRAGVLQNSATASLASASGTPSGAVATLSGTLSLLAGDIITVDVISAASGTPSELAIEY